MASTVSKALFSLFLASALFFSGVLGRITCEQLDHSTCAFAVSSSGLRCVLEKHVRGGGRKEEYSCRNSGVAASGVAGWIETNECVEACGLDRDMVGISSDYLVDRRFKQRLCSSECYHSCPNVVDLYANVAAGEGSSLSNLCQEMTNRRKFRELINSLSKLNTEASNSPVAAPAVGRKLIGWFASAPQARGERITIDDVEDKAAGPV